MKGEICLETCSILCLQAQNLSPTQFFENKKTSRPHLPEILLQVWNGAWELVCLLKKLPRDSGHQPGLSVHCIPFQEGLLPIPADTGGLQNDGGCSYKYA